MAVCLFQGILYSEVNVEKFILRKYPHRKKSHGLKSGDKGLMNKITLYDLQFV
jgi:hypothetical protein